MYKNVSRFTVPFLSPFLATCFIVYDAEGEIGLYDCRRDISLVLLVPRVIRVLGTYLLTYPFSDQKKKKKVGEGEMSIKYVFLWMGNRKYCLEKRLVYQRKIVLYFSLSIKF